MNRICCCRSGLKRFFLNDNWDSYSSLFWWSILCLNSFILLGRFILMILLMTDTAGNFEEAPDLPAVFVSVDAVGCIFSFTVAFFLLKRDITKFRFIWKVLAFVFLLETFVTGVAAIIVVKQSNSDASLSYYIFSIASFITDGLFFLYLLGFLYFVHKYDAFLSHTWNKEPAYQDHLYHDRVEVVASVMKQHGSIPWIDHNQNGYGGRPLRYSLLHGMLASDTFVIFLCKEYYNKINSRNMSDDCCFEFFNALALFPAERIFIVHLDEWSSISPLL
jgi:hypothetical protein